MSKSKAENKNTQELTPELFKEKLLQLETENLRNIEKADKKQMVAKIMHCYEELNNDNK